MKIKCYLCVLREVVFPLSIDLKLDLSDPKHFQWSTWRIDKTWILHVPSDLHNLAAIVFYVKYILCMYHKILLHFNKLLKNVVFEICMHQWWLIKFLLRQFCTMSSIWRGTSMSVPLSFMWCFVCFSFVSFYSLNLHGNWLITFILYKRFFFVMKQLRSISSHHRESNGDPYMSIIQILSMY